jgi:hypothetical protein
VNAAIVDVLINSRLDFEMFFLMLKMFDVVHWTPVGNFENNKVCAVLHGRNFVTGLQLQL